MKLALIALRLGLISPSMRAQFAQWGEVPEVEGLESVSHEEIDFLIEQALQQEDLVACRVTDLEALEQFVTTQRLGHLHLVIGEQEAEFEIVFGTTRTGDILIPWKSEDVRDVLLDPSTYLTWGIGREHSIGFRDVHEVYYGDVKAFMCCTPKASAKSQG